MCFRMEDKKNISSEEIAKLIDSDDEFLDECEEVVKKRFSQSKNKR